jgi:hypothetical protein
MNNTLSLNFSIDHEPQIKQATEEAALAAIKLLADNIQDDSLYLLFEWNNSLSQLQIVVTDSTKTKDAPQQISATFHLNSTSTISSNPTNSIADQVKFWLHDYLSSCTEFLRYSLVAIFHASDRNNTELL